ncbi:DUF7574 domain-containing protein [Nocardia ignorata]|uniref:DUF7574 domain-containing protein n=1 Tax=Nocardia ignorata TaxID=145285 RepID=A0A4R6NZ33_NOCIG|nr:hypothetical protein [Nocardia ignorata]TDP29803.1 hypothetical protein DFR75_11271 [Nocardia ignorata]
MRANIYFSPEKSGLSIVGELDFSDGNYCFNYTVVWQNNTTHRLYMADDAGCSCPSPFEDTAIGDLTEITTPQVLITHLNKRFAAASNPSCDLGDIGALIQKARDIGNFTIDRAA